MSDRNSDLWTPETKELYASFVDAAPTLRLRLIGYQYRSVRTDAPIGYVCDPAGDTLATMVRIANRYYNGKVYVAPVFATMD